MPSMSSLMVGRRWNVPHANFRCLLCFGEGSGTGRCATAGRRRLRLGCAAFSPLLLPLPFFASPSFCLLFVVDITWQFFRVLVALPFCVAGRRAGGCLTGGGECRQKVEATARPVVARSVGQPAG